MRLRTSDDWADSLRLSPPESIYPGSSYIGVAPDGEPQVVWTEQSYPLWAAFYARRNDGYAVHLIRDSRAYQNIGRPFFLPGGTVRWGVANQGLQTVYLYTLDGVAGASHRLRVRPPRPAPLSTSTPEKGCDHHRKDKHHTGKGEHEGVLR